MVDSTLQVPPKSVKSSNLRSRSSSPHKSRERSARSSVRGSSLAEIPQFDIIPGNGSKTNGRTIEEFETIDLEAQKRAANSRTSLASEYQVSTKVKWIYLTSYFALNLGLTLYNKSLLGDVGGVRGLRNTKSYADLVPQFSFPLLLTALHSSFVSVGCFALQRLGYFNVTRLSRRENITLICFSVLYTANIATSNVSLSV